MESTISFDLVSPEHLIFNDKAGMIIIPGKEGDIGVLSGHSNLLSSLRSGRVMVYDENRQLIKEKSMGVYLICDVDEITKRLNIW